MRKYDVIFDVNEPLIDANNRKYATFYIALGEMPVDMAEDFIQRQFDTHANVYEPCKLCVPDTQCRFHQQVSGFINYYGGSE